MAQYAQFKGSRQDKLAGQLFCLTRQFVSILYPK